MDQQQRNQPEPNDPTSFSRGGDVLGDDNDKRGNVGVESGNVSNGVTSIIIGNRSHNEEEVRGIMSALDTNLKQKPKRISFYTQEEGAAESNNFHDEEKKISALKAGRVGACHAKGGQDVQGKKTPNLEVPYGPYWEEGEGQDQQQQQQQGPQEKLGTPVGAYPVSGDADPLETIMPFPTSSSDNHRLRESRPGSFAVDGPGSFAVDGISASSNTASDVDSDSDSDATPPSPRPTTTTTTTTMTPDVMAVANMVNEEDEEEGGGGYLPRAQGLGDDEVNANIQREVARRENKQQLVQTTFRLVFLGFFGIVVVVVVFVVLVVIVLPNKDNNSLEETHENINSTNTAEGATTDAWEMQQSTSHPTAYDEEFLFSMLPTISVRAIEEDPNSPQARAFEWLLEDLEMQQQKEHDQGINTTSILQRFSLTTLYYATGGEQWRKSQNWLQHNISECDWYSEFSDSLLFSTSTELCNSSGHVEHLGLKRNNLINSLPPEVFLLLTNLKALSAGLNRLEGPIPTLIGKLTNLEGLWLLSFRNGGVLPTQIGLLTNLKAVSFVDNQHTGTLPTQLSQLTKLRSMTMGQNPQLKGPIPDITHMSDLLTVSVERNNGLTGTIATEIGQLSKLRWFVAGGNNLHGSLPSQLGLLPKIKILSVYGNKLTGTIPTLLGGMNSISLLSLRDNLFEGTLPSELGLLTNLEVALNLEDNPYITGTIPTELGLLTDCYYLTLGNNNLNGRIPSQLGMLRKLGKLSLENNALLTGPIPTTLEVLHQSLYYFDVSGNPLLSGTLPGALCNISGTCTPHIAREACPTDGTPPQHMAFDCTNLLSGCGCGGKVNSSSVSGGI